jgi:hypothetical protein
VTLATITFISLLLYEFDTGLLAYEKEQKKKSNACSKILTLNSDEHLIQENNFYIFLLNNLSLKLV